MQKKKNEIHDGNEIYIRHTLNQKGIVCSVKNDKVIRQLKNDLLQRNFENDFLYSGKQTQKRQYVTTRV